MSCRKTELVETDAVAATGAGSSRVWRVALVEDHLSQRRRTEEILGGESDLVVVSSCSTLPEFMVWLERAPRSSRPHLLVLDLVVDRGPSVDSNVVARLVDAGLRVLVLSALASPTLVRSVIGAGVSGVVGKRDSEQDVIDADRPRLSDQEERALSLYASGLTLAAVAEALGVKPDTAKTYIARVKAKYAAAGRPASSKLDLSRIAVDDGYVDRG